MSFLLEDPRAIATFVAGLCALALLWLRERWQLPRWPVRQDWREPCVAVGQDWREPCVALGLYDGRLMLVDVATGKVKWSVQAHLSRCDYTAMSPDGKLVASVGGKSHRPGRQVSPTNWKLCDSATGAVHRVGGTHDGTRSFLPFFHSPSHEGRPKIAHTGQGTRGLGFEEGGVFSLAFSPCGQRFATGGFDGAVIVWDVQSGEAEKRMIEEDPKAVSALCFSADGVRLASGDCEDGSICVWDTTSGALLSRMHDGLTGEVASLHFSPTEKNQLVSAIWEDIPHRPNVALWDVEKGTEIWSTEEGMGFAVFHPNGRTIATSSERVDEGDEVRFLDSESGAVLLRMGGHTDEVFCYFSSFSDDGSKLATVSSDGTCKVWDSSTGALLHSIEVRGEGSFPVSVAWGRDWVRAIAFAMGHHPRLGAGSQLLELDVGVVRMILDRA